MQFPQFQPELLDRITSALTADVPTIPLFWILPLGFYLLSFVLAFAKRQPISHEWLIRRLPFLISSPSFPLSASSRLPCWP
jgi:hypothetical protein